MESNPSLLLSLILLWLILRAFLFLKEEPKKKPGNLKLNPEIACPTCSAYLSIEKMLDASVCFEPGAIVFDCPHCNDRIYFSPYENHIEIGRLGCSPVLDPIPFATSDYPENFKMKSEIKNEVLHIQVAEKEWRVPSVKIFLEESRSKAKTIKPRVENS
jgi:DNA-directed RNA polymerase subunit RPC12/RpoP